MITCREFFTLPDRFGGGEGGVNPSGQPDRFFTVFFYPFPKQQSTKSSWVNTYPLASINYLSSWSGGPALTHVGTHDIHHICQVCAHRSPHLKGRGKKNCEKAVRLTVLEGGAPYIVMGGMNDNFVFDHICHFSQYTKVPPASSHLLHVI